VSFFVVARTANALQILPFCSFRVIDPSERHNVVYVISNRIIANLTNRISLPFEQTDALPLATVTA
jgi:hypothetical protein